MGRVVAAWPSFALIGAYELLMRQVRRTAAAGASALEVVTGASDARLKTADLPEPGRGRELQRRAWQWAQANRIPDGTLPSGRRIARQFGRHERWGRLVKRSGCAGEFDMSDEPALRTANYGHELSR